MDHQLTENASKLLQQNIQQATSKESSILLARKSADNSVDNLIFYGKKTGTLQDWISRVNANLSTSASRLEGLVILRAIIQQCSPETFSHCCVTWVRLLISILQPHQNASIVEITSGILIDILRIASQSSEMTRDIAINHIPGLLGALLNADSEEWLVPGLRLLAVCMECFPGPCGAISYKIEALITPHLDSTFPDIQKLAQRCYPLLARLGGGGSGGVKYTEAYQHYTMKILYTLQKHLSVLYADFYTDSDLSNEEGIEPISLSFAPSEEPMRTLHLTTQLESLNNCLILMLRNEFPAKALIPVKAILEFISSALDVTGKTLGDHVTSETSMLTLVIPRMHQSALQVLQALIESCSIIQYNHQVNQICLKMLGWTYSQQQVKPFRNLRAEIYRTIVTWLKTAGVSSGFASLVGEKLIVQSIQDASLASFKTKLTSDVQAKTEKKGGKVKVKGQTLHGVDPSSRGQQNDQHLNRVLCLTALQALRQVILTCGVKLKANLHQDIYKFVIPLLLNLQSSDPSNLPPSYTCSECRRELYGVLLAGVLVPHPQASSPLNLAVGIFREGKNDQSLEVSSACVEASVICDAIIHPRRPPVPRPRTHTPPTSLSFHDSLISTSLDDQKHEEKVTISMDTGDSINEQTDSRRLDHDESMKSASLNERTKNMTQDENTKATSHGHSSELMHVDAPPETEPWQPVEDDGRTDEKKASDGLERDAIKDNEEREGKDEQDEHEEEAVEDEDEEEIEKEVEKGDEGGYITAEKMEEIPGTSSRKRKHETNTSREAKKTSSDQVESMMLAFVNAPPDED